MQTQQNSCGVTSFQFIKQPSQKNERSRHLSYSHNCSNICQYAQNLVLKVCYLLEYIEQAGDSMLIFQKWQKCMKNITYHTEEAIFCRWRNSVFHHQGVWNFFVQIFFFSCFTSPCHILQKKIPLYNKAQIMYN